MNKSKFKFFGFSTKKTLVKLGVCFLFVCFFGSLQLSAQTDAKTYVNATTAFQLLDQEITVMTADLANLNPDSQAYKEKQVNIYFYEGVKRQLDNNAHTSAAISTNHTNFFNSRNQIAKQNSSAWYDDVANLLEE